MNSSPPEIILGIAEHLDTKSLVNFMKTSKKVHQLIDGHQHSISKSIASHLITHPLPNVFSSEAFMRRPLEVGRMETAVELEKRDAHTESVLRSSFFKQGLSSRFTSLDAKQNETLHYLVKNAMKQCNHIADIAANAPYTPSGEIWYAKLKGAYFDHRDLPVGFRMKDPYSNLGARQAQREYIESLAEEDLAMINFLLTTLSAGFLIENFDLAQADATFPERLVVFKECILRHGSWFAWSYILGDAVCHRMADKMQRVGLTELLSFEFGDEQAPASLLSTLSDRLKHFYLPEGSAWSHTNADVLGRAVYDLVAGGKKEGAGEAADKVAKEVLDEVLETTLEGVMED
ncbi:hypothetical protein ABKA04_008821 [Annulohypoxylon sp. FPYF3050]